MSLFRGITITHLKLPFFRLALTTMVAVSLCLAGASLLAQDQTQSRTHDQAMNQTRATEKGLTLLGTPAEPGKARAATSGPAGASAGRSGSAGSGSGSSGGSGAGGGARRSHSWRV